MKHCQDVALSLRQFDTGAVSTFEARFADFHLFALKAWGYTTYKNDCLCIANLGEQLFCRRIDFLFNIEVERSVASLLHVVYLDAVMLSGFHFQFLFVSLDAVTYFPDVNDGVGIHNQTQFIISIDVEDQGLVLCRNECAVKSCREVFKIYPRGEDGITAITQSDWRLDVDDSYRRSLHLGIIPIGSLDAFVAEWIFHVTEAAFKSFITSQSATLQIFDVGIWIDLFNFLCNAFKRGNRASGIAAVVAPHHYRVVGIRTHYDDICQ